MSKNEKITLGVIFFAALCWLGGALYNYMYGDQRFAWMCICLFAANLGLGCAFLRSYMSR